MKDIDCEDVKSPIGDIWKACKHQKCFGSSNLPRSADFALADCTTESVGNVAKGCKRLQDVAEKPSENQTTMHNIRISPYLQRNHNRKDGRCQVVLQVNYCSRTAYVPTGVTITAKQWNKVRGVVNHTRAASINRHIASLRSQLEDAALGLQRSGGCRGMSVRQVRDKLLLMVQPEEHKDASLLDVLHIKADRATKSNTKAIYVNTINRIEDYGDAVFASVTPQWLADFDKWLQGNGCPSVNARSIHLRNIRSAFNLALADGLTTAPYPFKKFHIKNEPVMPMAYTSAQMHQFLSTPAESAVVQYWVDMFALSFYLIGINLADLALLQKASQRVTYHRQKTSHKYSIKFTAQAKALVAAHKGINYLVDILERYKSIHTATACCNRYLARHAELCDLPKPTWYTARYSWASIAANECDISIDTISLALGHTYGRAVTLGYISPDASKVDKAAEQVFALVQ